MADLNFNINWKHLLHAGVLGLAAGFTLMFVIIYVVNPAEQAVGIQPMTGY